MSAALVLGRCLRKVLVCDAGSPRNAPARIFNGNRSRDGSTPGEFLQISRDQLRRYETVELRKVKVESAERTDEGFVITLETGGRIASRLLLIASGLVDELPAIEGFKQFYGKTAHRCPSCDGWERRGEPVVVVGGKQDAADLATPRATRVALDEGHRFVAEMIGEWRPLISNAPLFRRYTLASNFRSPVSCLLPGRLPRFFA